MKQLILFLFAATLLSACSLQEIPAPNATVESFSINGRMCGNNGLLYGISSDSLVLTIRFSKPIIADRFNNSFWSLNGSSGGKVTGRRSPDNQTLIFSIEQNPAPLTRCELVLNAGEHMGIRLIDAFHCTFVTAWDTTSKYPALSDDSLLTLVQQRTFGYFWEYGHPKCGMARERYGSGETVTTGGTGFGLMAMLAGIERGFITRSQGFARIDTVVRFLSRPETDKFHGAFPHWMNGTTGKAIAFSTKDNGADLVETAFLMQGLLTIREYFAQGSLAEKDLCNRIDTLWRRVEWDWFRQNGQEKLYWHWSPDYGWAMNMPVRGWNEGLIIYVLAAASPTHSIPKSVYDEGWAQNGSIRNGKTFYNTTLPLGEDRGGPMFFAHYSFLGLDPRNLKDSYADYWEQNTAHARINYAYCAANPAGWYGYSTNCWGLTASDIPGSYSASSPNNDLGVIAPTAALSSFPYTPMESLSALRFFYYTLGDKLWGNYGFKDAFQLSKPWFADSYLAIDQGPIVVMIENYRSALLWRCFMQNADVKAGLNKLGFTW